jgi:hypothetical protein
MDPDEACKQLRAKSHELLALESTRMTVPRADLGEEIAELFVGLDGWIRTGGCLPKAWLAYSGHTSTKEKY